MRSQNELGGSRTWSALLLSAALLACGDPTCPKGSVDQGGECVPTETCGEDERLENGRCVRMSGVRADAGDRDADPDGGVDAGVCAALDCGAHGRCEASGAMASCVCEPGHRGELCETCEPGLGPSSAGACVVLCEAEAAPDCGEHGECTVVDDLAQCACERGFTGETCSECAANFRAEENGSCVPDCGECPAHSVCDETAEVPACACVAGYRDGGSGCVWTGNGENGGGLVDGELEDPNAWQARHVTIDRGAAMFVNAIVDGECTFGALSQRFDMPQLEHAEPLALELVVRTACTNSDPLECPALLVETGSSVSRVQVPGASAGTTRTLSLCLGESAYGGTIDLRIRPSIARGIAVSSSSPGFFDCELDAWPVVEAVGIRAASEAECPLPSGVPQGELDAATGWTTRLGVIADGQLALQSGGTATSQLVFPLASSMPGAALHFLNADVTSARFNVSLGGLLWNAVTPGLDSSVALCIPDWALGAAHELELKAGNTAVTLEAISIAADASCGDSSIDRGFEREVVGRAPGMRGSWEAMGGIGIVMEEAAWTGAHGLRMPSAINGIRALARIPESTANGGAAFRLWYRVADSATPGNLDMLPFATTTRQLTSTQWMPHVSCLESRWQGQLMTIALGISVGIVDIDEVGPALDPECK